MLLEFFNINKTITFHKLNLVIEILYKKKLNLKIFQKLNLKIQLKKYNKIIDCNFLNNLFEQDGLTKIQ